MGRQSFYTAIVVCGISLASGAHASPTYSGQFVASWSHPVLTGTIIDGGTGSRQTLDDSTTAACSIAGCPNGVGFTPGSTTLAWGVSPQSSTLNFDGHFLFEVAPDTTFDMGKITFFNGTSVLNTLIFGATLDLTWLPCGFCTNPGLVVDPLHISVPIVTTANTGTAAQNADWVGPFGTPIPMTFNVLEGFNANAELFGRIVGDPQFHPEFLVTTDPNAFIGNGRPLGIPEPTSTSLFAAALAVLGLARGAGRQLSSRNGMA